MRGLVDDKLDELGLSRQGLLGLRSFLPALGVVQASRAIVTLPERIARAFASRFDLVPAEPPIDIPAFLFPSSVIGAMIMIHLRLG